MHAFGMTPEPDPEPSTKFVEDAKHIEPSARLTLGSGSARRLLRRLAGMTAGNGRAKA